MTLMLYKHKNLYKLKGQRESGFLNCPITTHSRCAMNISQDTKLIPLTQGKFAIVDADDYERLMQFKWHCSSHGYAARALRIDGKQKKLTMHRFLMNEPKDMFVDHADGNRLNNSKSNLRICTPAGNQANTRKIREANKSGFKGVHLSWCKRYWVATVYFNKKILHRSFHRIKQDAVMAYDEAAIKHHGEFAVTNKMMGLL